jgi:hypothetical protein
MGQAMSPTTDHLLAFPFGKEEEKENKTWAWSFVLVPPKSFIRITWHCWQQAKEICTTHIATHILHWGPQTPKFSGKHTIIKHASQF